MANRTGPAWHRDRVRQLEREHIILGDELTPEQGAALGIPAPVAARLRFVHEKTFDDAPGCEKPGVVVPLRRDGK